MHSSHQSWVVSLGTGYHDFDEYANFQEASRSSSQKVMCSNDDVADYWPTYTIVYSDGNQFRAQFKVACFLVFVTYDNFLDCFQICFNVDSLLICWQTIRPIGT